MAYDRAFWEQLWEKTLREHPDKVAERRPNTRLIAEVGDFSPGRAISGTGVDAVIRARRRTA